MTVHLGFSVSVIGARWVRGAGTGATLIWRLRRDSNPGASMKGMCPRPPDTQGSRASRNQVTRLKLEIKELNRRPTGANHN